MAYYFHYFNTTIIKDGINKIRLQILEVLYMCVCVCVCVFTQTLRITWMEHKIKFQVEFNRLN